MSYTLTIVIFALVCTSSASVEALLCLEGDLLDLSITDLLYCIHSLLRAWAGWRVHLPDLFEVDNPTTERTKSISGGGPPLCLRG